LRHVLDLGCGIGGRARYIAATFGCKVIGIDLNPAFINAATYMTARWGLAASTLTTRLSG
jgi:cyclopropane fatty-acyl-phospholipid synthase-like methyltransferase